MAFEDLHMCRSCGAMFEGDELVFDADEPNEEGDVEGKCPECDSTNVGSYD